MEPFYKRLRRLREEKNLTMRKMAKIVGVPETTYREWEYGRAIQGQPYLAMADALDVSLRELMTGERRESHKKIFETAEQIESALKKLKKELLESFE